MIPNATTRCVAWHSWKYGSKWKIIIPLGLTLRNFGSTLMLTAEVVDVDLKTKKYMIEWKGNNEPEGNNNTDR